MNRFARTLFALAVLCWAIPSTSAFAQPKETSKAAEGRITAESLKTILEGLGYDITEKDEVKDTTGKVIGYSISLEKGYTFHPQITISGDQSNLWFVFNLMAVPDPATVPSKILLGLMTANDRIYPGYFGYYAKDNLFTMKSFMANKGLKAKDVKLQLETMGANANAYDTLWNSTKWEGSKPKD